MKITEAQLEAAIIELLGAEGYPHVFGEAIDLPDGEAGRPSLKEAVNWLKFTEKFVTKKCFNL